MTLRRPLSAVVLAVCGLVAVAASQVEVTTDHNDAGRTGADLNESILNTSNVNVSNFGKLFARKVDGQIYAQPLYLSDVVIAGQGTRNVVYVATEHNSVYAFDADNSAASAPLWKTNLGPTVASSEVCRGISSSPFCPYTDLVPELGITSTPVIDPATGTLYVVAKTQTGSGQQFMLHALDVATGNEKFGGPVQITASVPGSGASSSGGTVNFDASHHLNRPGLLLFEGEVFVAFGAVGDIPPFHGWVMGYNAGTLQQVSVLNTSPDGEGAGIWAGGVGLAADGNSIFLTTGNGTFDGNSGGRDWANSFLRLQTSPTLSVADYFAPHDQGYLTSNDLDVGGGGPVLLPNMGLVLGVGKDGVLRLVDKAQFGKYNSAFNNDLQEFQSTGFFLGAPVFWNGPHGPAIYVWGVGDQLRQYGFAGNQLQTTPLWQSTMSAPGQISNSVPLSLSADGAASGSGIVWATAADSQNGGGQLHGILRAFDAEDVSRELWDSNQNPQRDDLGSFAKFASPTIANGKVYAPTFSGELVVYGLTAGDFSLNVNGSAPAQAPNSTTVQIVPQGQGLTSALSLSCSGLRPGLSCSFSPSSFPAGSNPMQSTLTITNSSASLRHSGYQPFLPASWLLLFGLCFGAAPLAANRGRRKLWLLVLAVLAGGLLVTWGCGGGGSGSAASTASPQTNQVTVVAVSGDIEHRSTITLAGH